MFTTNALARVLANKKPGWKARALAMKMEVDKVGLENITSYSPTIFS